MSLLSEIHKEGFLKYDRQYWHSLYFTNTWRPYWPPLHLGLLPQLQENFISPSRPTELAGTLKLKIIKGIAILNLPAGSAALVFYVCLFISVCVCRMYRLLITWYRPTLFLRIEQPGRTWCWHPFIYKVELCYNSLYKPLWSAHKHLYRIRVIFYI
jgi:hypothetical protein